MWTLTITGSGTKVKCGGEPSLAPCGPVTTTATSPAGVASVVARISVSELTWKTLAATPPKVTDDAPLKPLPVMRTWVPPGAGPRCGLTPVT